MYYYYIMQEIKKDIICIGKPSTKKQYFLCMYCIHREGVYDTTSHGILVILKYL